MSFCSSISTPQSLSLLSKTKPIINGGDYKLGSRFRASADVPDFLSADWYAKFLPLSLKVFFFFFVELSYLIPFKLFFWGV
jgi:hypothetical protein